MHVAAVLVSVQVLGQVSLGFELSIAQILVAILTCGLLEAAITFWRRHTIAWPASALLTGNGVALILRVPGTLHGDWWSLRGAWIFASVAAISLLSKYVIRIGARQLFNPSNLGLVLCFVALGTTRVNPQDLWWGRLSVGLVATYAIIVIGGLIVVSRLRMLGLALAFWLTFAAAIGVLALSGHCISARWHVGPVCGWQFWSVLVTSPEILIFLFFMITDPKTAPRGQVARMVYATLVALFAALMAAPMRTEFGTKVAILGGLVVVCAIRPVLERVLPTPGAVGDRLHAWVLSGPVAVDLSEREVGALSLRRRATSSLTVRRALFGLGTSVACAGLLVIAGTPARTGTTSNLPNVDPAQTAARPVVKLGAHDVPPVSIDASVHPILPSLDERQARAMARDFIVDLVIIGDALTQRDGKLAATAAAGSWLVRVQQQIAAARDSSPLQVPRYRFDHITVVLARTTPQSTPEIALAARGAARTDASPRAGARSAVGKWVPYQRTYILAPAGRLWLIAADQATN